MMDSIDRGRFSLSWHKRNLIFHQPVSTSRGILPNKNAWYLVLTDKYCGKVSALGECSPIPGLSVDNIGRMDTILNAVCNDLPSYIDTYHDRLDAFPSIQFGLEMILKDIKNRKLGVLFPSDFTTGELGITINGLIWMGSLDFMSQQITDKLEQGFSCIKIKIGALNFDQECQLIKAIRKKFSAQTLELRVDANGAFAREDALKKLHALSQFELHSIEQPIQPGHWQDMANLCANTPLPIALDEELIGVRGQQKKALLIDEIKPQYIVLKPSLLGGFNQSLEWIKLAKSRGVGWWVTSALESNIALNAIAQWVATFPSKLPQGLGTGNIYSNNIASPLRLQGEKLFYQPDSSIDSKQITVSA